MLQCKNAYSIVNKTGKVEKKKKGIYIHINIERPRFSVAFIINSHVIWASAVLSCRMLMVIVIIQLLDSTLKMSSGLKDLSLTNNWRVMGGPERC